MARSDIWRYARHADRAREVATVTAGITSYFGSAARDRSYKVTWGPIAGTYGGTYVNEKRVVLNPVLLDELSPEAPFSGEAVDMMQGVAAHEAGHARLNEARRQYGYNPTRNTSLGGLIVNVVEDIMIDGPAYAAYNPGLAVETAHLREEMAEKYFPPLDEFWRKGPTPASPEQLLSSWGCARLFRERLPNIAKRKFEQRYVDLLDVVFDGLWKLGSFDGAEGLRARDQAVHEVNAILAAYMNDPAKPAPQPGEGDEQDDGEDEGDGEQGGQSGAGGDGEEAEGDQRINGGGGGEGDESDDDAGEQNGLGAGKAGEQDGEQSEATGEGGDGGEDDAEEGDGEADGEGDGAGGKKGGSASKRTPKDWDSMLPPPCPSQREGGDAPLTNEQREFWKEVRAELEALEVAQGKVQGKVHVDRYTDKRTVAGIRAAYRALASEPVRQRRHETGRVDRRALGRALSEETVFTRNRDKALTGQVVLILDMSGSVRGHEGLLKATAASVYEALSSTDLKVWVYSYGQPVVAELATPTKVAPAFTSVMAGGGTPTAGAFVAVLNAVKAARTGSNVIIHVTDGQPDQVAPAIEQMAKARKAGWKVINIGINTGTLPFAKVSDSVQYIRTYTALPGLISAAVQDIVRGHKRGLSV